MYYFVWTTLTLFIVNFRVVQDNSNHFESSYLLAITIGGILQR